LVAQDSVRKQCKSRIWEYRENIAASLFNCNWHILVTNWAYYQQKPACASIAIKCALEIRDRRVALPVKAANSKLSRCGIKLPSQVIDTRENLVVY